MALPSVQSYITSDPTSWTIQVFLQKIFSLTTLWLLHLQNYILVSPVFWILRYISVFKDAFLWDHLISDLFEIISSQISLADLSHLDVLKDWQFQDMAELRVPDRISIITYLSQFYHRLKEEDSSRFIQHHHKHQYFVTCPPAA